MPDAADSHYSLEFIARMSQRLKKEQGSAEANSSAQKSETAQTTSSGMARDEFIKKLPNDPRFEMVKPSGKGFVIGGVKPAGGVNVADQAAERDPPYLAQLLKDHPGLTREEALEMIRDAGG